MRNLFLALILANLLFLAWHVWIDPTQPAVPVTEPGELALFGPASARAPTGSSVGQGVGTCLQMGPLPSIAAAQQVRQRLATRGIDAVPVAREAEQWLGHWVQIEGFSSLSEAETAQQRLIGGGLADAYLMQDGTEPIISLGVFRERTRADRLAEKARTLGFEVRIRDRYRPTAEQWLLIRPFAGQTLGPGDLSIAGDRIMRTEMTACAGDTPSGSD
ncbi:MAG: SPOR domain-containing protein [Gammaproteobacteria bacterium]|nr:SPOR domain-containing protein [Gammaproteobacteria bacterium]